MTEGEDMNPENISLEMAKHMKNNYTDEAGNTIFVSSR